MEKEFVNGLFVKRRETCPKFVKAELSFNDKFIDFLKDNFNARGWVNISILESREGKLYAKLDKPKEHFVKNNDGSIGVEEVLDVSDINIPREDINVSEIPF